MREIKFRGKDKETGKWVYGYYMRVADSVGNCCRIIDINGKYVPIIPETRGEFTGLLDKNGKDIFEGDIVKQVIAFGKEENIEIVGKVGFFACSFEIENINKKDASHLITIIPHYCEVIGNVHENKELLKVYEK